MANSVKAVLEGTSSSEKAKGFVTALFIIVAVLTTVDFLGRVEFRSFPETYATDIDENEHVLGFPSHDNAEYKLFVTSIGEFAGSVTVIAEKRNSWKYNGTFYLEDTVLLGNLRVTIKEINLDKEKPILLEYYQLVDLKPLLVIALIVLAILTYFIWKG